MSDTTETGTAGVNREAVVSTLTKNLKQLYSLAQWADEQLVRLRAEDKGQFSAVFQEDSPFTTRAQRFLPYMVEVAEDVTTLLTVEDGRFKPALNNLLAKIQLLQQLLRKFYGTLAQEAPQPTTTIH